MGLLHLEAYHSIVDAVSPITESGRITKVVGFIAEAEGPACRLGGVCDIYLKGNALKVKAEVVGFRENRVLLMPFGDIRGIAPGGRVVAREQQAVIGVGEGFLGRIVDGLGNPIDNRGPVATKAMYPIYAKPMNPFLRKRIRQPLDLGIRAINGALTIGCGQRMGIFAGSGVGKSVLLGMIARNTSADVNVIALIGERGRELNEFIQRELGKEGLKRSVVVVATSDSPPLVRMRGIFVATTIAEYFRDMGKHVILMTDSVTRFAMAQREVGLAVGEPPTTKGYTPSVFTLLPQILERAGTCSGSGTITGLYTVLVEGDDMNEPVADAVRAILDGHIVLSRDLAAQNHYPAIDILNSVSRLMGDISSKAHKESVARLKEVLATYRKAEDLINIGAYAAGSNPKIDYAIKMIDQANGYLRQGIEERERFEDSIQKLCTMFENSS
ncbi:MAG: flagellar protein export ATPase FliI [Deltaproteobacteria bacterium]|nr:flagellar protein export ATPase FliI [Deltaproteobacteria bacterium]